MKRRKRENVGFEVNADKSDEKEVKEGRDMKKEDRRSIFALDWLFSIQVQGVSHFNN